MVRAPRSPPLFWRRKIEDGESGEPGRGDPDADEEEEDDDEDDEEDEEE